MQPSRGPGSSSTGKSNSNSPRPPTRPSAGTGSGDERGRNTKRSIGGRGGTGGLRGKRVNGTSDTDSRDTKANSAPSGSGTPISGASAKSSSPFISNKAAQDPKNVLMSNAARSPAALAMTFGPPTPATSPFNAPKTQSQGMDSYKSRFDALHKTREAERLQAIQDGFLADPDHPRTLAEAITPVGTCQDMCAEYERLDRITQRDVWGAEMQTNGLTSREPDEAKMVKKFRRPGAGLGEQLPSDLRPPIVLQRTVDYLFKELLSTTDSLAGSHHFVWDRTRAIRNDFSIQQVTKKADLQIAIDCYERIARFHISALHLLGLDQKPYEAYAAQQDKEQLGKTLLSLLQYYDDSRGTIQSPNEAEFRAYSIIFQIEHPTADLEDRVQMWPRHIIDDHRVQTALALYAAAGDTKETRGPLHPNAPIPIAQGNWGKVWAVTGSNQTSYLMGCAAELHFSRIRTTALDSIWKARMRSKNSKGPELSLDELREVFAYETEDQVQAFCESYGFTITEKEDGVAYLQLDSVTSWNLPEPTPGSQDQRKSQLVERKRHGRTLTAVLQGMSVRAAREAGMVEFVDEEMHPSMGDEDSLFVDDSNDEADRVRSEKMNAENKAKAAALQQMQARKQGGLNAGASSFTPTIPVVNGASASMFGTLRPSFPASTLPAFGTSQQQTGESAGATFDGFSAGNAGQVAAKSPFDFSLLAKEPLKTSATFGGTGFSQAPPTQSQGTTLGQSTIQTPAFGSFGTPQTPQTQSQSTFSAGTNLGLESSGKPAFSSYDFGKTATEQVTAPSTPSTATLAAPTPGLANPTPGQNSDSFLSQSSTASDTAQKRQEQQTLQQTMPSFYNPTPSSSPQQATAQHIFAAPPKSFTTPQQTSSQHMFRPQSTLGAKQPDTQFQHSLPQVPTFTLFPPSFTQPQSQPQPNSAIMEDKRSQEQAVAQKRQQEQQAAAEIVRQEEQAMAKRRARDAETLDQLARALLLGDHGLLDQFVEYMAPTIIENARNDVEDRHDREVADRFRLSKLMTRYGTRWRESWWKRRLAQQGRARRQQRARDIEERARRSRENSMISIPSSSRRSIEEPSSTVNVEASSKAQPIVTTKFALVPANPAPITNDLSESALSAPQASSSRTEGAWNPNTKGHRRTESAPNRSSGHGSRTYRGFRSSGLRNSYFPGESIGSFGSSMTSNISLGFAPDSTRSTYFKMKAMGLDPNALKPTPDRKRPRSSDSEAVGIQSPFKKVLKENTQPRSRSPSIQVSSPLLKKTGNPEDDELFATARQLREAMSEDLSFFQEELAKDDEFRRSRACSSASPDSMTSKFAATASAIKAKEPPPSYRNRISKFLPRERYADVLMAQRKTVGASPKYVPRRFQGTTTPQRQPKTPTLSPPAGEIDRQPRTVISLSPRPEGQAGVDATAKDQQPEQFFPQSLLPEAHVSDQSSLSKHINLKPDDHVREMLLGPALSAPAKPMSFDSALSQPQRTPSVNFTGFGHVPSEARTQAIAPFSQPRGPYVGFGALRPDSDNIKPEMTQISHSSFFQARTDSAGASSGFATVASPSALQHAAQQASQQMPVVLQESPFGGSNRPVSQDSMFTPATSFQATANGPSTASAWQITIGSSSPVGEAASNDATQPPKKRCNLSPNTKNNRIASANRFDLLMNMDEDANEQEESEYESAPRSEQANERHGEEEEESNDYPMVHTYRPMQYDTPLNSSAARDVYDDPPYPAATPGWSFGDKTKNEDEVRRAELVDEDFAHDREQPMEEARGAYGLDDGIEYDESDVVDDEDELGELRSYDSAEEGLEDTDDDEEVSEEEEEEMPATQVRRPPPPPPPSQSSREVVVNGKSGNSIEDAIEL